MTDSADVDDPADDLDLVLIGTGSEVSVCLDAKPLLEADGLRGAGRVDAELDAVRGARRRRPGRGAPGRRADALGRGGRVVRLGALGRRLGGDRPLRRIAPGEVVLEKLGFTAANVADRARRLLLAELEEED